jgi:hypothetical protein
LVTLTIIDKWEENSLEMTVGGLNPRKMNSPGFWVQGAICSGKILF